MKRPASDRYRVWIAAAVLLLALLAGWWLNRETEPEAPPPAASPAAGSVAPRPAGKLPPAQRAGAERPAGEIVDIFAVRTWEPPPPPAAAVEPARPQAPPLPFRFMGRIAEPGKPPVFLLLQDDRVVPVKLGDRIGGAYRLEKLEGGQLFFRYRPMNAVQTLAVGNAQ